MGRWLEMTRVLAVFVVLALGSIVQGQTTVDRSRTASGGLLDTVNSVSQTLEEMWQKETQAAQQELERLLQSGLEMSMPMPQPTLTPGTTLPPAVPSTPAPQIGATFPPTPAPNCLLGRTPEQYLLDELLQITSVNELLDPNRPQGMAFNFILGDTAVRSDVCAYRTIAHRIDSLPSFTPRPEASGRTIRDGLPEPTNVRGLESPVMPATGLPILR